MKWFQLVMLSGAMALIAACSGGSGGTGAGPDTSTVSSGQVTATDNATTLSVNGTQYSVSGSTTVTVDGVPTTLASVQPGDVVLVQGSSTGAATADAGAIESGSVVKGPLQAAANVDLTAAPLTITVMGQTVIVDAGTVIDGTSISNPASVASGTVLKVSGFVRDNGLIAATRIEREDTPANYEVKGYVENVTPGVSFMIGNLVISYTGAVTAGTFVEVKGNTGSVSPLVATLVEIEDLGVSSAGKAEVEGYITTTNGPPVTSFTIGTQEVTVSGATQYKNGSAADLVVGREVEAEGPLVAGVIQATEIEFEEIYDIEGEVDTVTTSDGTTGSVTVKGMPGVTLSITTNTDVETVQSSSSLNDISNGSYIRAKGYKSGVANTVLVSELRETDDPGHGQTRAEMQGDVTVISGTTSVTILGQTIDVTVGGFECRDRTDATIACATLLGAMSVGDIAKARGTLSGATISWERLELE